MQRVLIVLVQIISLSVIVGLGPERLELDKNDPTRPENTLEEYSLPEQHRSIEDKDQKQKEEDSSSEEVEKREDMDHTQERL